MNHVFPSLCLAFVIAASPALRAQVAATDTQAAIEAAVKRQSKLIEVRGQIGQGRTLEAQKDVVAAAQQYNKALQGLREIGGVVEPERSDAVAGLARTTLILADIAMRAGRFDDAKAHIDRVLVEDPKNKDALEMRVRNDRFIAESIGRTPHREAERLAIASETNRVEVQKLVMDGKLFYETGLLKEAEAVLRKALTLDPDNRVAEYYLNLVNGRRYIAELRLREMNSKTMLMEVERQWRPDEVKREALPVPNPYIHTNNVNTSDRRQMIYRKLRNIRLTEIMYDGLPLSEVVKQISEEARRRDIETDATKKGINFLLSPNADSATAVPAATGLPGVPGAPAVIPGAEGLPAPGPETFDLAGVVIKIGTPMRDLTLEEALNVIQMVADKRIKWSVEDFGVVISPKAPETVPLHTRFFKVDPNTFWQGLANVTTLSFGESQQGSGGGGGGRGGGRGGGGRGNRGGGNFGGGGFGGNDGQSQGGANYAGVSIAPGGQNQQGGNRGNQGTQRFGQAGRAGQPGAAGGTQAAGGGALTSSGGLAFLTEVTPTAGIAPLVRDFFAASGVLLDDPGKAVFFNDRTGVLMVRATLQDLDLIEKAVQMLNMAPPQMTIRAKFMEVNQDDNRALGFDWFLGNMTFGGNGAAGVQGGTAPSFQGTPTANNPSGWFPGPGPAPGVPGPFVQPPSATDNLITGGLRNSAPALGTLTGILTDPQFRLVVRAIEQRGGSDLLSAPEVTTQSGRQAQIKIVDVRYIVTDLDTDQTAAGVGTTAVGTVGGGGGGIGSLITPLAEPFELGPVLDVVPYVNADGYTITMTLLPTLKEFLGYDDPGQFVAQVQGASTTGNNQQALTQPIPLPKFRLRQVATTANVWDGQTVVLGGLISENVQKQKDKVPMLGDVPFLGRFFRSESNISSKKNLVIFVTPRLIDPAGNPLHLDQDMPFAQHSVPTQAGAPQGGPRAVTQ